MLRTLVFFFLSPAVLSVQTQLPEHYSNASGPDIIFKCYLGQLEHRFYLTFEPHPQTLPCVSSLYVYLGFYDLSWALFPFWPITSKWWLPLSLNLRSQL